MATSGGGEAANGVPGLGGRDGGLDPSTRKLVRVWVDGWLVSAEIVTRIKLGFKKFSELQRQTDNGDDDDRLGLQPISPDWPTTTTIMIVLIVQQRR